MKTKQEIEEKISNLRVRMNDLRISEDRREVMSEIMALNWVIKEIKMETKKIVSEEEVRKSVENGDGREFEFELKEDEQLRKDESEERDFVEPMTEKGFKEDVERTAEIMKKKEFSCGMGSNRIHPNFTPEEECSECGYLENECECDENGKVK